MNAVAGPEPEEPPLAAGAACGAPVTFDAAITRASALVPGGRFKSLYPIDYPKFRRWELVLEPDGAEGRRGLVLMWSGVLMWLRGRRR